MAVDERSCGATDADDDQPLAGERLVLVGRLSGRSRGDAIKLIQQAGGQVVEAIDPSATLVVLGDEHASVRAAVGKSSDRCAVMLSAIDDHRIPVAYESEIWRRLGLVDDCQVRRLYTPAMLAEMVAAPVAAVRHWHRQGALRAALCVQRLPYFEFAEAAVAQRLAQLYDAGCSLRSIDRKLAELSRLAPHLERPLANPSVIVEGRRLVLRRGDDLAEPGGQLLLDFNAADDCDVASTDRATHRTVLQFSDPRNAPAASDGRSAVAEMVQQLANQALDLIDAGELERAAEAYRAVLMAGGASAEIQFALADVLYRSGDLSAARERYYAALEADEGFVEARANLGCVLAEQGDLQLAVSAFQGALAQHPEYADVHYHLAGALDGLQRWDEAAGHYRAFLSLAPESPWAAAARSA